MAFFPPLHNRPCQLPWSGVERRWTRSKNWEPHVQLLLSTNGLEFLWRIKLKRFNSHFSKKKKRNCCKLEREKISSIGLQKISTVSCKSVVKAEIDAPNLLSFHYDSTSVNPTFSSSGNALQQKQPLGLWHVELVVNSS
ncbi:hypothetical protein O6P43_026860 [Quillaja saponaria]|uniref:Uncharacterized protein n=1 Tax=Quillaja saponaria TaxID=32244 RepID=A0AAD7L325_QUISA|nr:hypothetical protein O6P43_026860 [Quillaja saponaria]